MLATLLFIIALSSAAAGTPFSMDFLLSSIHAASSAYCSAGQVASWSCMSCALAPELAGVATMYNATYNLAGYVGYSPEHNSVYVVYRGTIETSIINWVENLKAEQTPWICSGFACDGAKTHLGFTQSYFSLVQETRAGIYSLMQSYPSASLTFVGHSLGGAMAVIAAMDALNQGYNGAQITIITMGEPRAGNAQFALAVGDNIKNVFRITNHKDLVPHVPTQPMGFHHTALEIWIHTTPEDPDSLMFCNGSGEDPNCSDSVIGDSVNDHLHYMNITLDGAACTSQTPQRAGADGGVRRQQHPHF
jgi:hypothetical protein